MIHKFTYQDNTYEVDDSLFFDKQNKGFRKFWQTADKISFDGYSFFENEDITITIYDRGGVMVSKKESEANND